MGVAPDVVADVGRDDVERVVVSEGKIGAGFVEVMTTVVASAVAPAPPPLLGLVTTEVTTVVSS